jgi:hypothetical protein
MLGLSRLVLDVWPQRSEFGPRSDLRWAERHWCRFSLNILVSPADSHFTRCFISPMHHPGLVQWAIHVPSTEGRGSTPSHDWKRWSWDISLPFMCPSISVKNLSLLISLVQYFPYIFQWNKSSLHVKFIRDVRRLFSASVLLFNFTTYTIILLHVSVVRPSSSRKYIISYDYSTDNGSMTLHRRI